MNEFVADFVGTSNVLERGGERFTVRPEKIEVMCRECRPRGSSPSAAGRRSRLRGRGDALHGGARRRRSLHLVRQNVGEAPGAVSRPGGSGDRRMAAAIRGGGRRGNDKKGGGSTMRRKRAARRARHGSSSRAWSRSCWYSRLRGRRIELRRQLGAGGGGEELQKLGEGEAELEPDLLGRLHRTRMGQAVRKDPLQGQRQGRRHLGRNGEPDGDRAVRRGLRLRQRDRPPLGGPRSRPGERLPGPELRDRLQRPEDQVYNTFEGQPYGSRTAAARTC